MSFRYFVVISFWKMVWSSFEQAWIPFTRRCFVLNLVEISASGSWEDILNFVNVFLLLCNYLPLETGVALHLNKLESPSPKDASCEVWFKLAQRFWKRRFLNFVNVIFCYFVIISSCKYPSFRHALCHDFLKLAQWFWKKRNRKSLRRKRQ